MRVLPFFYGKTGLQQNRLIVEPTEIPSTVGDDGLLIPARTLPGSGLGRVFATCEKSDFKPGDEVQYMTSDLMVTISIKGKIYHVIYEHKIWVKNDEPYNQIFIKPMSDSEISEDGLITPADAQCISRKGIVFKAPEYLSVKPGDRVEYQNQLQGYYPQVEIDNQKYDVLFESDIFKINEDVAPYRIIVKIDKVAQFLKRNTTSSGLKLSPLFIHMLRNLQYAEIVGIGSEAQKLYPEIKNGDTVIIDHAVESQDYRLVKLDLGKNKGATYEYRVLNCYTLEDREIFGKLHYDKSTNKIIDITPLGGSVFLEWNFTMFDQSENKSELLQSDNTLSHYDNLDSLKSVVARQRALTAEKAKLKTSGIKHALSAISQESDPDRYDLLMSEYRTIEREEKKIAAFLRIDHLVVCKTIYPRTLPSYVISPYEELYPINIMGKKLLIGHPDFLLFKTHTNMNIKPGEMLPIGDVVIVRPIEEEAQTDLLIPDSAQMKPQYGEVISIGENKDGVKNGDTILFRQGAGLNQSIGGVKHLIMKHNDMLCVIPAAK